MIVTTKLFPKGENMLTPQEKFNAFRLDLQKALIERDDEIDVVLCGLIAQETVLLVGAPGTAKSLMCDSVTEWMHGTSFSVLFSKYTTPEEVYGPISVLGLKTDDYRRLTNAMLPEAEVAFLDEIFKASSAILNTLLRILNERRYRNGKTDSKVPLRFAVAASNEWPGDGEGGKELTALFDRFLLRKKVKPVVSAQGKARLRWDRDHKPKLSCNITAKEIDQARTEAMALPWTDEAHEAFDRICSEINQAGVFPGDRRQYKAVNVCQAFAYLAGADKVEPAHLEVLSHVLWDDPAEQPEKVAQVVSRVANPVGMKVNELLGEVEQVLAAANLADLGQAATAAKKLSDVVKKLKDISGGNGRVARALDYVKGEIKRIKAASMNAID